MSDAEFRRLQRELDQLRDWVGALDSLLTLTSVATLRSEPAGLVRQLATLLGDMLSADGGLGGLCDGERIHSEGYARAGAWHALPREWRLHEGLPGSAVGHGWHHVSNDYPADPLADAGWRAMFDVRHALCVPIIGQGSQPLGFFELHRGAGRPPFSHQEVGFLESIANITAVALANARLVADLERQQQEIEALRARQVAALQQERDQLARELQTLKNPLSAREREVLDGIARGATTAAIAKTLGISAHTAVRHRARLMLKLGAHNTAELLRNARARGLLL